MQVVSDSSNSSSSNSNSCNDSFYLCKRCTGNSHHRVSVCVSVTRRYCTRMAKRRITQTTPHDIPGSLVFWCQNSLVDDPLSPGNLRSKWPNPLTCSRGRVVKHSAAMCSRAWRAQWPGFDSARARPPTKELFLIIPTHMMNREINPGRKKEGSTVSSINCDRCRQLDPAVSSLPAAPAWVEANRLGWPLVGVIHSASLG